MSKPTPGPWSSCLNRPGSSFLVRDKENRLVCDMSWHSSSRQHYPLRDESEANARLIAAAPDLLDALLMVSNGPHDAEAIADMLPTVRAAIAKATGSAS